uniref:SJCHGC09731 protein n=1 Tax=Schistosoma japonicum TaxID=6182 RepID=Q5BR11_SCHJA|nr:SJCHGC09731 protein [Schistosoma japonicum]
MLLSVSLTHTNDRILEIICNIRFSDSDNVYSLSVFYACDKASITVCSAVTCRKVATVPITVCLVYRFINNITKVVLKFAE